jgi:hypothetical protein
MGLDTDRTQLDCARSQPWLERFRTRVLACQPAGVHSEIPIAGLLVVGFLLTATNGVASYRGARRRLQHASQRITSSGRYATENGVAAVGDRTAAASAARDAEISAHEVLDAVNGVLRSGRTSLLLAGLGLLVSTIAALWGVFA